MMDGITPTMPLMPASTSASDGALGGAGGGWIWILLIFLLLGGKGLGAGNDGVAANAATNFVNNDFLYTQRKIDDLGQAVINQTNALNMTMNDGFNSNNAAINNLGFQTQQGFCGIERSIDQVRFENAQNTCTITSAIGQSTQDIKDLVNSNTMQDLRDRNATLQAANDNAQQTAAIISQLRPYPAPSYLTLPPGVPFGAHPGAFGFDGCGHDHKGCCNPCQF